MTTTNNASTTDREIVAMRIFDAPRELVWKAWTHREHVARWWGPNGFTNTIEQMDVRPGGVWRFLMHGPDGTDYPNVVTFVEVVEPERLVYDHGDDENPSQFSTTATFEDLGGRTRLTMRLLFPTAAEHDRTIREHGAVEGLAQTLGRLEAYLPSMS
jgi:uncharacterized protein YndB with AHSA1/START domain